MNRETLRHDIYLRIKPKPSIDDNLNENHIDAIIDRYRAFYIKKEIAEAGSAYLDPAILSSYEKQTCTPLADQEGIKGHKLYLWTLPSSVIDLPNDAGVYSVESTAGDTFRRIDKRDVRKFLKIPMATLDKTYYRLGETLYFIKKVNPKQLAPSIPRFNIDLVIGDTLGSGNNYVISDSDPYPVSEGIAAAIIEAVVQQLKFSEDQPVDYISDGVDE